MKDPIRPCVQEKCPNKKQRTQGLIYRTNENPDYQWNNAQNFIIFKFVNQCHMYNAFDV